ncbi:MAG: dihydroorotase [Zhongshania sp.]|jgi:dihydroorotase
MQTLEITRPDDWHIHLRDGEVLVHTVADASRYFGRIIVMPNLTPPVRNLAEATAYKHRIEHALPATGHKLQPLMVIYLTDNTSPEDIAAAAASDVVFAAKLYPAGATTNSDSGVTNIENLYPIFECMEKHGLPLLVHGEVTDNDVDIFDREAHFIDRYLRQIVERFTALKLVLEHITTSDSVQFVQESGGNVAATITAHHLLYNRNHMLAGGIRPHYYCLPILKRNTHQQALIAAATSGNPKFFLGTDSAPHARDKKETSCGCAGCYTAYAAMELYAEAFETAGKLEKLEAFASFYGADFYGLPRNSDTIILQRNSWTAPEHLPLGSDTIFPLRGGEQLHWQLA